MSKVIQCVPNFSEGRRPQVVHEISRAIQLGGARVLDCSFDPDHNRSVITIIGSPDSIRSGVVAGVGKAVELIDMRSHTGAHPRIGAADVIPLVPVRNVSMDECVLLSRDIGGDIAQKLGIPVYFYENSALRPERRNLAYVRRGGFERLLRQDLSEEYTPDLGPDKVHPTAGATAVGARGPLIAFNVDLMSDDMDIAIGIASAIRRLRDEGRGFEGVKAIAISLASRGIVQVSTNITQPEKVSMFDVYDFVRRRAADAGVTVLRSELIGMTRLDACAMAVGQALQLEGFGPDKTLDYWLSDVN